jgi:UDP-N-acetyl-2-amino-2-deoxyglucuronate dehydrogenase
MNFVLIGIGYVSCRHLEAIKAVGGNLIAATDPHDSVGILDSYFPGCEYFSEFERFDRHIDKLKRSGTKINYVSICSPNYLHDAHCRWALRIGADAICEKPLVCYERNLEGLIELEKETGKRVWTILQLRLHENAIIAKEKFIGSEYAVEVDYSTPRGKWYYHSWKGNVEKSGGLSTNIGVHLFDLATWLFGDCEDISTNIKKSDYVSGVLYLQRAAVCWGLSIKNSEIVRRHFSINNEVFDFTNNFTNLHIKSYENILNGKGFGIEDVRQSIKICETIRNATKYL